MCEEHSVIAILRREKFPKYLNRKKEEGQYMILRDQSLCTQTKGEEYCCSQRGFGRRLAVKGWKKKVCETFTKSLAFAKIWSNAPLGALLAQGLLLFKIINSQLNFCQRDWLSQCSPINLTELEDREEIQKPLQAAGTFWDLRHTEVLRNLDKSW